MSKVLNQKTIDSVHKNLSEVKLANAEIYIDQAISEVRSELEQALCNWPEFNSAHEGFAVLLEEVDELKRHVWTKQKNRDLIEMRKEAVQVAAMAIRFAIEVSTEERGRR